MSDQEKIIMYISRTKMKDNPRYGFFLNEYQTMYRIAVTEGIFEAFCTTFNLGKVKGYRMAKNEEKNGKSK